MGNTWINILYNIWSIFLEGNELDNVSDSNTQWVTTLKGKPTLIAIWQDYYNIYSFKLRFYSGFINSLRRVFTSILLEPIKARAYVSFAIKFSLSRPDLPINISCKRKVKPIIACTFQFWIFCKDRSLEFVVVWRLSQSNWFTWVTCKALISSGLWYLLISL